jgi:ABC-type Fe3+ transport system substrate-binding protein
VPADSPNPYGAALVIDWLLSADGGQALYDELNRRGPRGDMDYPYQEEFEAIDELVPYSVEAVVENPDAADILNDLFAN